MRSYALRVDGGRAVLERVDAPAPVAGPGQVLLKMHAAGLNRGDLASRRYAVPGRPGGLEQLAADIPQPHEPWAVAFFAAAQEALARFGAVR